MKVGIVVDDWKLPIFRRRLAGARYQYTDAGGLTPNTTLLTVETDDLSALSVVVQAAQKECSEQRAP